MTGTPNPHFDDLRRRLGEIDDIDRAAGLLAWDEETKMPPAGADVRAEQRATLNRVAHELQVSAELGELFEQLRTFEESHDPESFEASIVRVGRRDYEKAVRVPPELRARLTRAASLGYRAWLHARDEDDYSILLPHLRRNLDLRLEYIACFEHSGDPYDVLLDDYEPGTKTADVAAVFDELKRALIPMLGAAADAPPVDDSCLLGHFPRAAQRRFSLALLAHWGMNRDSWRLDRTVHPFAISMSSSDIRLTTFFHEDSLHGLLSCMHEFGHGLYERQIDPRFDRTPLGHGASAALHESQSRMWENLVGRSRSMWSFFYPQLQQALPEQLGDVPLDAFHRALNAVHPTLRRVDSDEISYCLHIILRFELERAVLAGDIDLADLPEAFDAKMREYLGLQPPDISQGVLQDVHWSDLSFGYFPTYALGNVMSVQLWERAAADLGDLDEQFERGEFAPLRAWLGEHVHRHGRVLTPPELLRKAAGADLDAGPYLVYLERKLAELSGTVSR